MLTLIREKAGFDLSGYKSSPVLWRIQQRMEVRHARAFEDYLALLEDDPVELETLVRSIPIHVTEFFRDPQAWEALRDEVVRPLMREDGSRGQVRVWTVGCATGEEAYSVAMLLSESAESSRLTNFQVFATDASPEIVACASHARFLEKAVEKLSAERRARFFYFADHAYRVKRSLRETMVFASHDLLADPPFNDLDLVTCRNLLIYLEPEALYRAVFALHRSLRVGGYLFLGKSEFLPLALEGFERVSPHALSNRCADKLPG